MNNYWERLPEDLKSNPLFHFSAETNYVPHWDKINVSEHAGPAIEFAMGNLGAVVMAISTNEEPATFENVVEPLHEAMELLSYLGTTLHTLSPKTDDERKARDEILKDLWRDYEDAFLYAMNFVPLFKRFVDLDIEKQKKVWTKERFDMAGSYLRTFVDAGIRLDPERRKAHIKIQKDVGKLAQKIHKRMDEVGDKVGLFVQDPARLQGIPEDLVASAAKQAKDMGRPGEWAFMANRPVYERFMATADDRALRQSMWELYWKRMSGPYNTSAMIKQFMKKTHDLARIKGRQTPANEILTFTMAKNSKTVGKFLTDLRDASMPVAQREMEAMAEFARNNLGIDKIEMWDINTSGRNSGYIESKMKKSVLGYDDEDLKYYFELESTLDRLVFPHFKKQLGLTFVPNENYPKPDPSVRAYDVRGKGGRFMGVLMLDLFDRPGKAAGLAWSMSVLSQGKFDGKIQRPVNKIDMKLTQTEDGKPVFLTHEMVTTLMHEFGHSVHDLKSECEFSMWSGTGVDRDFVEFPSQFQEYIAYHPEFLKHARHYYDGTKIPEETQAQIQQSRKYMAGRYVLDRSMRAWLDLQWYKQNPDHYTSIRAFEEKNLKSFRLEGLTYPLFSPSFSYTFGGGYDAGFYGYDWAQRMSDDLLEKFNKYGLYNKTLTGKFAQALTYGGNLDEAKNYRQIAGRNATLKPFLRATGLVGKAFNYAAAGVEVANDTAPVVQVLPKTGSLKP